MLKQTFNWIDTALAVILALVLGVSLGAYAWISWQPRDITPQVMQWVKQHNADNLKNGYQIHLDSAVLSNQGFAAPLAAQLKGVTLTDRNNQRIANIPLLAASPSLIGLLKTGSPSANIEVIGAEFAILQDAEGSLYLDTHEQAAPMNLSELLFSDSAAEPDEEFHMGSLFEHGVHSINISKAQAQYKSELTGFQISIPSLSLSIDSVLASQQIKGHISAAYLNSQKKPALIQSDVTYDHSERNVSATLNLHRFIASQFATVSRELANLEALAIPLSGQMKADLNINKEAINEATFSLRSKEFAELMVEGRLSGRMSSPILHANGTMQDFNKDFLLKNWPQGVGKDAHRWISESIREANVTKAEFDINLTPERLAQSPLPKEAVNAVLHIEEAVIDYVPGFPAVKKAKGRVIFAGQSLKAEIDAIKMLQGTHMFPMEKLSHATVEIPDLLVDNIQILIDVPLEAPISDVIRFTESTPYKLPPSLPIKANNIRGKMQGVLSMQVLDRISPIEDEVDFQLEADLKSIAYPELAQGVSLSHLGGSLKANNSSLDTQFNGKFNAQNFTGKVSIDRGAEKYHYQGHFPAGVIGLFAKEAKSHLTGAMQLKADITRQGNGSSNVSVNADTTGLRYTIPYLDKTKPVGTKGDLSASGTLSNSRLNLSKLKVKDNAISFDGTLGLSRNSGQVTHSTIHHLSLGANRLKGNYVLKAGQHHLTLTSPMLDVASLRGKSKESGKTVLQHLADIPDIVADIKVEELRFGDERRMNNLQMTANCVSQRCEAFSLSADAGKTSLKAAIKNVDGKRSFTADIPDLGRLLRVTGVFDDIRNGSLKLNAIYQDNLPDRPMVGRLTVDKFNTKNIPLLAKLLTVATFTGVLDALSGGGIYFDTLEAPFQYNRKKLVINEAKATGPSVGITASGTLDVTPDILDVKGVVIPAKLFDTILTDIPLVGDVYTALTGGDGLVAVNYSMTGKTDDPKVKVNPLSALTPGFLRKIFSKEGGKNPETKQDVKGAKEALEEVKDELKEMENQPAPELPVKTPEETLNNVLETRPDVDEGKKSLNKHKKD